MTSLPRGYPTMHAGGVPFTKSERPLAMGRGTTAGEKLTAYSERLDVMDPL